MSSDSIPPPFRPWPEGAEIKTFKGRCHCGKITFEFDHPALEVRKPISCNCSLCSRTGAVYIYGPETTLRLTGEEPAEFLNKTKQASHRFCPACGNLMFGKGMGLASANVRMLEGVEIDYVEVEKFDGARLL